MRRRFRPAISVFESGAILLYLAEKTGRFLPKDVRGRFEVLQWLFCRWPDWGRWGPEPSFHPVRAGETSYAIDRYVRETSRLYAVLDKQLADRISCEDYSIADWRPTLGGAHQRRNRTWLTFPT